MRFESQPSAELRRPRGHERREWNGLRDHDRDTDGGERDRHSNKSHRTDDARRREAASQIRELRSRY